MLYVAFLWHQHQPYYMDPSTGEFGLPWVRLHAIKDYIGMANLLAEFPQVNQNINFVPSLVKQITQYLDGVPDRQMALTKIPADSLKQDEAIKILDTFFMLNWEQMVNVYPRYKQLLVKRDFSRRTAAAVVKKFTPAEMRDLQVWANLAWFHPTVIEKDADLQELIKKDHDFTEDEKAVVLDKQLRVMADVIPLHKALAASGQLEISTTPFYHPIIPLLCDPTKARVAAPSLPLPQTLMSAQDDAVAQVQNAVAYHEKMFGSKPRGIWPSEGSVSDDATAIFADAGLDWLATDEEILARTIGVHFGRDGSGMLNLPDRLYAPYRLRAGERQIHAVFRDHAISDFLGFRYYFMRAQDAANDLIARLDQIRRHAPDNALVTIALDGENCWEHYRNQGVDFLRLLYSMLSHTPEIKTIRICDYIDRFGTHNELGHIFPGSWIGHNFCTWMGHWEKNRGWEYLARAKKALDEKAPSLAPEKREAAREELFIAEGSDWFWWYGDDHSSGNDADFDALFRRHLRAVYDIIGVAAPDELLKPIIDSAMRESWRPPRGLLQVTVDGRRTSFFEWLGAGIYEQALDSGSMQRSEPVPITEMHFGFNEELFYLRFDGADPTWKTFPKLEVELWLNDATAPAIVSSFDDGGIRVMPGVEAARQRLIEISAPMKMLGVSPGSEMRFYVRISESGTPTQRIPATGLISFVVPANPQTAYTGAEDLV